MTGEEMYLQFKQDAMKDAGITEKNVDIGKFNICYQEGGEGETVLLVHGFSASKDRWSSFIKYFTPEYHVVAIDLPGHGNSSKIESESYSIENQAERLDQFVSKLGLNKFHIAGNSMGGAISGKYTESYPDKVLSLTLFDSGSVPSANQSEFYKLLTEEDKNIFFISSEEDFDMSHRFRFAIPPPIPEPMKGYMVKQSIENRDFNEKIFQDLMTEQYSLEPDLPKINTRTLIIWGDKDRIIDVSSVEILEKGLSDSESVIMKDCGHVPMMERPEEAAKHYLKFLKKK